jgi:hypothetical protein
MSAVLAQDVNYALLFVRAAIMKADNIGAFTVNRPSSGDVMKCIMWMITFLIVSGLGACSTAAGPRAIPDATASSSPAGIEDIYVLRSLRETRSAAAAFCDASKIGFTARSEDRYLFKAVSTRPQDGKIVDARFRDAGTLHACFESAPGAAETNFYAEGVEAGVAATGNGKCIPIAADFPEQGITSVRCFLVLSNLSAPYVAGVLTTNSITSREPIGDRSDPPGYTQPSIAIIRLWRKR